MGGEVYVSQEMTTALHCQAPESSSFPSEIGGKNVRRHATLLSKLQAGGSERAEALFELRGSVRRLAFDVDGCRVVQLALDVSSQQEASELAAALHGYVRRAITSPHGNYVIQKIIETMPMPMFAFIISELHGHVAEVARHRFGCRIICRLLEHSCSDPKMISVTDEILKDAGEL